MCCAVLHWAAGLLPLLLQIAELMKTGRLKVTVDQVLPLAEAAKAHEISEKGHVRGKLIIQVAQQ